MLGGDPGRVPLGLTLDNWQLPTHLRWTFQHIAEFLPTAAISRGAGVVAELPLAHSPITDVTFYDDRHHVRRSVGDVMASTATDGWIVLQHGRVIDERYYAEMHEHSSHLLMSVSKSLIAAVVGALTRDLGLDVTAPVTHFIPALAQSGYAGASVRDLLDMRSGVRFSEDYLDPAAEVRILEQAIDWLPRTTPGVPSTMYGFLASLIQEAPHGGPFRYRSCETDVLGWVCEAATGISMPALMSETVWSRLGAQQDAVIGVDSAGTGMFDGGINTCLRDLVRFGSLFLTGGVSLTGVQVVPASWIYDTFAGGPDSRAAFAASTDDNQMPGGMYRNQCWFPYPDDNVLLCLGIHGQMIYVNRAAQMVAAKLSSWPYPQDSSKLFPTIAAFDAVAKVLS